MEMHLCCLHCALVCHLSSSPSLSLSLSFLWCPPPGPGWPFVVVVEFVVVASSLQHLSCLPGSSSFLFHLLSSQFQFVICVCVWLSPSSLTCCCAIFPSPPANLPLHSFLYHLHKVIVIGKHGLAPWSFRQAVTVSCQVESFPEAEVAARRCG